MMNLEHHFIFGRVAVCAKMVQQMESEAGSVFVTRAAGMGDGAARDTARDVEVDDEVDNETVDVGVSVVAWRGGCGRQASRANTGSIALVMGLC